MLKPVREKKAREMGQRGPMAKASAPRERLWRKDLSKKGGWGVALAQERGTRYSGCRQFWELKTEKTGKRPRGGLHHNVGIET